MDARDDAAGVDGGGYDDGFAGADWGGDDGCDAPAEAGPPQADDLACLKRSRNAFENQPHYSKLKGKKLNVQTMEKQDNMVAERRAACACAQRGFARPLTPLRRAGRRTAAACFWACTCGSTA